MLRRDGWNRETAEFVVVRRLELGPPLIEFDVAHAERLTGLGREPIGDAPALLLVVDRQVDDLAAGPDGAGDPAER